MIKYIYPMKLPRRCGEDKYLHRPAVPSNCTIGPKLPMYWYQNERNNVSLQTESHSYSYIGVRCSRIHILRQFIMISMALRMAHRTISSSTPKVIMKDPSLAPHPRPL